MYNFSMEAKNTFSHNVSTYRLFCCCLVKLGDDGLIKKGKLMTRKQR